MNVTYIKDTGKKYMILQTDQKEHTFSALMIMQNDIRGLLPFECRMFNGKTEYYYDITGKHTLEESAQIQLLQEKDIRKLLQALYGMINELNSFFLEAKGLLLEAIYIYNEEENYYFAFHPSEEQTQMDDKLAVFAEQMLELIDHEDEECVWLTYRFYKMVKESEKGVMNILEDVLTQKRITEQEEKVFIDEKEPPWYTEEVEIPEKKFRVDYITVGCFFMAFVVSLCYLLFSPFPDVLKSFTGLLGCIFTVFSMLGMAAEFVDIDIAKQK